MVRAASVEAAGALLSMVLPLPSVRICSMAVSGGTGLPNPEPGWTEATPLRVLNQRLPSTERQAAGWPPLLDSEILRPSAVPKTVVGRVVAWRSARALSAA